MVKMFSPYSLNLDPRQKFLDAPVELSDSLNLSHQRFCIFYRTLRRYIYYYYYYYYMKIVATFKRPSRSETFQR